VRTTGTQNCWPLLIVYTRPSNGLFVRELLYAFVRGSAVSLGEPAAAAMMM
jgi:hypothetical protein